MKGVMCKIIQAASFREPSLDQQTLYFVSKSPSRTPSPMPRASLIYENHRLVCPELSGESTEKWAEPAHALIETQF